MKHKSGLADSPFFSSPPHPETEPSTAVFPPYKTPSVTPTLEDKQASLQTNNLANKPASLLTHIQAVSQLKATNAATFRFPPELLEKLEDIEYRLRKNHKIKTTKNAILVGALAMLLYEFDEKADESHLYKFLVHP